MKKIYFLLFTYEERWEKTLLKINFAAILFVFSVLQANANAMNSLSYSQELTVSVKLKRVGLIELFNALEKKTGYSFMYKDSDVIHHKGISIDYTEEDLTKVLDDVLSNKDLSYELVDGVMIIKPLEKTQTVSINQTQVIKISGKVIDENGVPLPGTNVVVAGTKRGVMTDFNGKFEINVQPGDVLKLSYIGYKDQIVLIKDQKKLKLKMEPEVESIEEVSIVAFGEQKKESVVSSITTVKASDLKTSSSDLTTSFAGKIAGLIGWQTGGAPGALTEDEMNTRFYIRGITSFQTDANIDPLILLDGIEVSKLDLARVNADDIESFNVMKDASATAMYGARGANGVIYVTTKKGEEGNVRTTFRVETVFSEPTDEVDVVSPTEYMNLYNQALLGRAPVGQQVVPAYTQRQIDNTNNPNFPSWVYPATDWYNMLFEDHSVNHRYSLNVRGGGSKIQYYASLTHNRDSGILRTDPLNQFDVNIQNSQTNFRTNLNINLNNTAKLILNTFSTYDDYHGPISNVRQIYYNAFTASPVDFAPVYPEDDFYNWPHIRFGGGSTNNPYAELQAGYSDRIRYSTINRFEYIQNLSALIKGLELRASVGITKRGYFTNNYSTVPAIYRLSDYNFATGEHRLSAINEAQADRNLRLQERVDRSSTTIMDYQLNLQQNSAWGDHQTNFTGVFTARERNVSTPTTIQEGLPYRNVSFSARATYGYKDRYFLESNIGINGSERFARGNKFGYFPSIGGAWIASKEKFLESSKWLSFLKFRFSYGRTGNDGVINNPRFVYLQSIEPSPDILQLGTRNETRSIRAITNYGNRNTEWETSEQTNLGVELKFFKGLLETNIDIYQEIRHNIYTYRSNLPASVGLDEPPLDNIGKVRSRGLDFSGKIQHAFSGDLWFILNGTFTYNKATYKEVEQPYNIAPWQNRIGQDISQRFTYIAEGLFQDREEIETAPLQGGDVQPGDIRYRDVDGNGVININDAVAAGFPETPRINYGFSGTVNYKGLEANISFQGSGNRSFFIDPAQISPFAGGRNVLRAIADDHWTPENQQLRPLWPQLSTDNITTHNPQESSANGIRSTYFMRNGSFLRCTQIGLGYNLKKKWIKKYRLDNMRLFATVNNPFIISGFDLWDIELGGNGFNYPIQRTYSMGLSFSF